MTPSKQYPAWLVIAIFVSLSCQKEIVRDRVYEPDYALEFDGATTFVEISMMREQQPAQLTVEVMINLDDLSLGSIPIIAQSDLDQWNRAEGFIVKYEELRLYWCLASATRTADAVGASVALQPKRWYHIACTFDGRIARVFLDGKLLVEEPRKPFIDYGDRGFSIGRGRHTAFGGDLFFKGQMDEIRLWDHARTETQILTHRHRPLVGDESGLIGYWNFNGRAEYFDPAEDRSPSRNHGQVAGKIRLVRSTAFSGQ